VSTDHDDAPAPSVDIPAGGRVAFHPGGLHVMLIGIKQPLQEGGGCR